MVGTQWKKKKVTGWIKLHAAVDVDTNEILPLLSPMICRGHHLYQETDGPCMATGHDVVTLLADAGYDSKENWNLYSRMGIKVCINIKSTRISEKY